MTKYALYEKEIKYTIEALLNLRTKILFIELRRVLLDDFTNWKTKVDICKAIRKFHAVEAAPELLTALKDDWDHFLLGEEIIETLVKLQIEEAASVFIDLLMDEDKNPDLRYEVANNVGNIESKEPLKDLFSMLTNSSIDSDFQEAAACSLCKLGTVETFEELFNLLINSNTKNPLRVGIARGLEVMNIKVLPPEVVWIFSDINEDPHVQLGLGQSLIQKGFREFIPILLNFIQNDLIEYWVRDQLIAFWGEKHNQLPLNNISEFLKDEAIESSLRGTFAFCLDHQDHLPELIVLLNDSSLAFDVRVQIGRRLSLMGDNTTIPHLTKFLKNSLMRISGFDHARTDILIGLGKMKVEEVTPDLLKILEENSIEWYGQIEVIKALENLGAYESTSQLIHILMNNKSDKYLRRQAAKTLCEFKLNTTIPLIFDVLLDESEDDELKETVCQQLIKNKVFSSHDIPLLISRKSVKSSQKLFHRIIYSIVSENRINFSQN